MRLASVLRFRYQSVCLMVNICMSFPVHLCGGGSARKDCWVNEKTAPGVRVEQPFSFPASNIASCIIHGEGEAYSVEVTHRCKCRRALYEKLVEMLPGLLRENDVYWFRTVNQSMNPNSTCLFDGAHLEMQLVSAHTPECAFCFPRRAFIEERDAFDRKYLSRLASSGATPPAHVGQTTLASALQANLSPGWMFREPSDSERLRVNRHGWEIMFVLQPSPTEAAATISRLRMELCRLLSISDSQRVILTSGPFVWGQEFQEDGKDYYNTYFSNDIVVDARSMKTVRGSALMYVLEAGAESELYHPRLGWPTG